MSTASVYADEVDLRHGWCDKSLNIIKPARWKAYLMLAKVILEFYVQSIELRTTSPLQELMDFSDKINTQDENSRDILFREYML